MFKNEEGFSLLELSVAAAIAVGLGAVAVVGITGIVDNTKGAAASYGNDANTSFSKIQDETGTELGTTR